MRRLPHLLTFVRLVAAPVLVWLVLQSRFREALVLIVLAGITDWFDGFAARRLGVTGQLGVILDPLADKIMLVALFLVLGAVALVPIWLVALVIGRDVIIVLGALLLRVVRNIHKFLPSTLGKVSTFFQITTVVMVLVHASFPYRLFLWLEIIAIALCAFFTAISGMDYLRLGIQMTLTVKPPR